MKRLLLVLVGAVLFCSHLLYASSNELCAEELSSTNFQEGDYIALRALYLSTDGDNWTDNSGWPDAAFFNANPTLPAGINPVSWLGINLDDNGCLSSLYLNDNFKTTLKK